VLGDPRTDADIQGYTIAYFGSLPASPPASTWQTWHAQRQRGALGAQEQGAAVKATAHADTPATAHFDTLGRPFLTLADNGPDSARPGQHLLFASRVEQDIEGNLRVVRDAIVQAGDPQGRIVMRYDYDMLGNRIHQSSMEAGQRWMLNDIAGKPIRGWDSRDHSVRTEYDEMRRPLRSFVIGADLQNAASEICCEESVYGESAPNLTPTQVLQANLRGKLYRHFDTAGVLTSEAHDFKGNLLRDTRQLLQDYKATPDWSRNPQPVLETEIFTSSTRYNAPNRPIQMVAPHSNQANGRINVLRPSYNEANLLESVDAWLGQTAEPSTLLDSASANLHAVVNIDYDAKGQRSRLEYGNGAVTEYFYDKQTFRLIRLNTSGIGATVYQALSYAYDPVGNITHIGDNAQQTIYFNGQAVVPQCDYAYDALYRLINATGREHMGQLAAPQSNWNDEFRTNLPHPGDGQKMRNYTEQYVYDAVGNFEKLIHQAANGNWTRTYIYGETSLVEDGVGGTPLKTSNRLSLTKVGNNNPVSEPYAYDTHGNMTSMPHLTLMQWDFKDQLSVTSRQVVNTVPPPDSAPETSFYLYDAGGQRLRKATERQNGSRKSERIYLGGFEIYREFKGNGADIAFDRETLHIMDDRKRLVLVEDKTAGEDGSPPQFVRYQSGNHLGSASLELDDQARIISYEEYSPYGSTSYQAVRNQTKTLKRYRYTGKERDEETGFAYHGARYYAGWLGRWTTADPVGTQGGINLYAYTLGNPIRKVDQTGTDDKDFDKAVEGAIDKLDQPGNPFEIHGKSGGKQSVITLDIDEPRAVGQRDISLSEARARATDVSNRQFLDPRTNRQTKHLGTDTHPSSPARTPVSVVDNPDALLTRRFSEVTELDAVFNEAVSKIRNPGGLKPTALKEAINAHIWNIVKTGTSDAAIKLRGALATLGFENVKGQGYTLKGGQPTIVESKPTAPRPEGGAGLKAGKVALGVAEKAAFIVAVGEAGKDHESTTNAIVETIIVGAVISVVWRPVAVLAAGAFGATTPIYVHKTVIGTDRNLGEGLKAASPTLDQTGTPYKPPPATTLGSWLGF